MVAQSTTKTNPEGIAPGGAGGATWAHVQWCLDQGWSVFPLWGVVPGEGGAGHGWICACKDGADCDRAGKHPAWAGGHNAAVDAAAAGQLQRWWADGRPWNIGIRTGLASALLVLDIDPRNGGDESLDEWEERTGLPWVPGARVSTGGGGRHEFYRWPEEYLDEASEIGGVTMALPGVDVKCGGGYVVGPGSFHEHGRRYEWLGNSLPTAPLELMQWVQQTRGKGSTNGTEKPNGYDFLYCLRNGAPEGMRDVFFNELAFRLWAGNLTRAQVTERMRAEFDRAEPGHSWNRVLYQIDRVFSMTDEERKNKGFRPSAGVATGDQIEIATRLVDAYRQKVEQRKAHGAEELLPEETGRDASGGGGGVSADDGPGSNGPVDHEVQAVAVVDTLTMPGTPGVPANPTRRPQNSAVLFDGRYLLFRDKAFEDLADALLDQWEGGGRGLAHWRGDFYHWTGTHWARVTDVNDLRMWITVEVRGAMLVREKDGERTYSPWDLTNARIAEIIGALERSPRVRRADDIEVEHGVISFVNGVLDIRRDTLAAFREISRDAGVGGGVQVVDLPLIAHDRRRWITQAVPYAWNPTPGDAVAAWESWLAERVPDAQDRAVLQEWFGYVLSGGRPWMHKFLYMQGLPRTGKSTTVRILRELVGTSGMHSFTSVGQLVDRFALSPAIGKTVLHFNEVRWDFKGVTTSVDMLTQIIGGDEIQIDRKNRELWVGTHSGRVSMTSNNPPAFRNESGALLQRMIHVEFGNSFAGAEDPTREEELLRSVREGGLAAWAVEGLLRLMERGKFSESARSRSLKSEMRAEVSPVSAFVEEVYAVTREKADEVGFGELHMRFLAWCAERGINPLGCGTIVVFSRTLFSVVDGVGKWERKGYNDAGKRVTTRGVWGLRLREI